MGANLLAIPGCGSPGRGAGLRGHVGPSPVHGRRCGIANRVVFAGMLSGTQMECLGRGRSLRAPIAFRGVQRICGRSNGDGSPGDHYPPMLVPEVCGEACGWIIEPTPNRSADLSTESLSMSTSRARHKAGQRSQLVETNYSWQVVGHKMIRVYEWILGGMQARLRRGHSLNKVPDLARYDNSWYSPGRNLFIRSLWFFLGLPILRSSVVPSSALRRGLLRCSGRALGRTWL